MITWTEFERRAPALARAGREQFYRYGIGIGQLATIRKDGAPRVHPVCPVIGPTGLHVVILPGPKRGDLRRDGRYSLHSDTAAPPREDDGCAVSGSAAEVSDEPTRAAVREQVLAERGALWPGFDDHAVFELLLDRCLLMLTNPGEGFPKGATIWTER